MQVFQTDSEGFYVGKTIADADPLDKGRWLIPQGCVTVEPPPLAAPEKAKFYGGEWVIITEPEPEPEPDPEVYQVYDDAIVRSQRNDLLAASDWTQVADAPVDKASWADYRQALRDIPQQAGFPENVIWPEQPV